MLVRLSDSTVHNMFSGNPALLICCCITNYSNMQRLETKISVNDHTVSKCWVFGSV